MKNTGNKGRTRQTRKNVISESELRKIVQSEIRRAARSGALDEGFFDDVKSRVGKFFGMGGSEEPSAKSEPSVKSPQAKSEIDIKRKAAKQQFEKVKGTLQTFYDNLGEVGLAVKNRKPPPGKTLEVIMMQVPAVMQIINFGKQTIKGLDDVTRQKLIQDLVDLKIQSKLGGEASFKLGLDIIENLNFSLDDVIQIVKKNEEKFMSPNRRSQFDSAVRAARELGEPFVFEGKLMKKLLKEDDASKNAAQASGGTADAQVATLATKLKSLGFADAEIMSKISSALSDVKNEKYDQVDKLELAALGKVLLKMIQSGDDAAIKSIMNILTKTDATA